KHREQDNENLFHLCRLGLCPDGGCSTCECAIAGYFAIREFRRAAKWNTVWTDADGPCVGRGPSADTNSPNRSNGAGGAAGCTPPSRGKSPNARPSRRRSRLFATAL